MRNEIVITAFPKKVDPGQDRAAHHENGDEDLIDKLLAVSCRLVMFLQIGERCPSLFQNDDKNLLTE